MTENGGEPDITRYTAASTGNPVLDQIVRENMTEAIGIVRAILSENFPHFDPARLDAISAAIPQLLLRPIATIVIQGVGVVPHERSEDAQDT